jgi:DNA-binding transcriptional LysR family regulator
MMMETLCSQLYGAKMNLDGIDVFVRVVQANGFAAAARQLGMPTSTVSAKISRLEERLGVTLIQRSTRRMHLTASGEAYFSACLAALNALDAGESQLAAGTAAPRGLLRITAPSDLASAVLAPLCAQFLARYPDTRIDLIVTNRRLDLIGEGVDLAVRVGMLQDSSLISRKYVMGDVGLWAAPAYLEQHGMPRDAEALAGHETIGFNFVPPSFQLVSADGRSLAIPPPRRVTADDMQAVAALAAQGLGIAFLPEVIARASNLVRVLPEFSAVQDFVYFVYPAQRHVTANVRAFIDLALGK